MKYPNNAGNRKKLAQAVVDSWSEEDLRVYATRELARDYKTDLLQFEEDLEWYPELKPTMDTEADKPIPLPRRHTPIDMERV